MGEAAIATIAKLWKRSKKNSESLGGSDFFCNFAADNASLTGRAESNDGARAPSKLARKWPSRDRVRQKSNTSMEHRRPTMPFVGQAEAEKDVLLFI